MTLPFLLLLRTKTLEFLLMPLFFLYLISNLFSNSVNSKYLNAFQNQIHQNISGFQPFLATYIATVYSQPSSSLTWMTGTACWLNSLLDAHLIHAGFLQNMYSHHFKLEFRLHHPSIQNPSLVFQLTQRKRQIS